MKKSSVGLKAGLVRVTLTLLFLGILASTVGLMPVAKAQDQALSTYPAQGPAGTIVNIIGMGFSANTQVIISFGSQEVATGYVGSMFGRTSTSFQVPSVPLGVYTITATDAVGHSATATFTVTPKATPTPAPTQAHPSATSSPGPTSATGIAPGGATPTGGIWTYPTYRPFQSTTTVTTEFWSLPLLIGVIVSVLVAVIIPAAFLVRRRGRREMLPSEESPLSKPRSPSPTSSVRTAEAPRYGPTSSYGQRFSSPATTSRYGQSTVYSQQLSRPPVSTRTTQPSGYSRPMAFTKVCPRCRRVVRDDYNLCPYCDKRLK